MLLGWLLLIAIAVEERNVNLAVAYGSSYAEKAKGSHQLSKKIVFTDDEAPETLLDFEGHILKVYREEDLQGAGAFVQDKNHYSVLVLKNEYHNNLIRDSIIVHEGIHVMCNYMEDKYAQLCAREEEMAYMIQDYFLKMRLFYRNI